MVVSVIQSRISTTELTIKPGQAIATFDVEVINNSNRHASFYIVLTATGATDQPPRCWYRLSPMSSSMVPPGTRSTYQASIIDTPLQGFVGLANITVRIISPELHSEERHVLRLRVAPGLGTAALTVELPTSTFQDYPGQLVEIPARIYNGSRNPITGTLSCPGLDDWLTDQCSRQVMLLPNRWQDLLVPCQIPEEMSLAHSQDYPFQIVVVDEDGTSAMASGVLSVLPLGHCALTAVDTVLRLPPSRWWWPNRQCDTTHTQLQVTNHSNLTNVVHLGSTPDDKPGLSYTVAFEDQAVSLPPGQAKTVDTIIEVKRPWFGWVRTLWIDLQNQLEDSRLDLQDETAILKVKVAPILPRWLQLGMLLWLVGAIAGVWFWTVHRQHHHQLVSSVQFNGVGDRVVSSSADQTIRQWQVKQWSLRPFNSIIQLNKAVRVSQYRPVDNNQLVVGLENGEIQIWDLLQFSREPRQTLVSGQQVDDRVMALTFSADSRSVFSGHGSGRVNRWYVGPDSDGQNSVTQEPVQQLTLPDFSVSDLILMGKDQTILAIAGRYNKLILWPWSDKHSALDAQTEDFQTDNTVTVTNYPTGGKDDYITSVATAEQNPLRLITADNQGRIMVWNLAGCVDQPNECAIVDQWIVPTQAPIRDIALSANGCYLVSASDDGQLILWPLTNQGRRFNKYLQGQTIKRINTGFNSVDIKVMQKYNLITSGADDSQVRMHRFKAPTQTCLL
ncbi:MAG: hypothetical protein AAF821_14480 [Cyanobacteria bacterium P01_D01_bin.156]